MPTVYEIMLSNYSAGRDEPGTATLLHPVGVWGINGPEAMAVQYHQTDVVTAYPDGSFVLRAAGYNVPRYRNGHSRMSTSTYTRERIQRYLPAGYEIYQQNWKWWIETPTATYEFAEGMKITVGASAVEYPENLSQFIGEHQLETGVQN